MKKLFALLLVLIMLISTVPAAADSAITVTLDGKTVMFPDAKPFIVSGRVMVPVRFVSQALGAEVEWLEKERTVVIKRNAQEIRLKTWKSTVLVDGKNVEIDAPPRIVEDRVFVPLRFVSQTLGSFVKWEDWSRTVVITSTSPYGKGEELRVLKYDGTSETVTAFDMKLPFKDIVGIEKIDDQSINVIVSKPANFSLYLDENTMAGLVGINGSDYTKRGDKYVMEFNIKQYSDRPIESYKELAFRFRGEYHLYYRVSNPLFR